MFFDIGANVGNWTISNLSLADKIISVEADSDVFKILEENTNFSNKIVRLFYSKN